MFKVILFTRTDDDQWRFELKYFEFPSFRGFYKYSLHYLKLSESYSFHYNFYKIEKDGLVKILYIHKGLYCTQ